MLKISRYFRVPIFFIMISVFYSFYSYSMQKDIMQKDPDNLFLSKELYKEKYAIANDYELFKIVQKIHNIFHIFRPENEKSDNVVLDEKVCNKMVLNKKNYPEADPSLWFTEKGILLCFGQDSIWLGTPWGKVNLLKDSSFGQNWLKATEQLIAAQLDAKYFYSIAKFCQDDDFYELLYNSSVRPKGVSIKGFLEDSGLYGVGQVRKGTDQVYKLLEFEGVSLPEPEFFKSSPVSKDLVSNFCKMQEKYARELKAKKINSVKKYCDIKFVLRS